MDDVRDARAQIGRCREIVAFACLAEEPGEPVDDFVDLAEIEQRHQVIEIRRVEFPGDTGRTFAQHRLRALPENARAPPAAPGESADAPCGRPRGPPLALSPPIGGPPRAAGPRARRAPPAPRA